MSTITDETMQALIDVLDAICAPDVRSILTARPPRLEDERAARIKARDLLLDAVAGRRLDAGQRVVAIHAIGKRQGWPIAR